jgi:hypothetical protein
MNRHIVLLTTILSYLSIANCRNLQQVTVPIPGIQCSSAENAQCSTSVGVCPRPDFSETPWITTPIVYCDPEVTVNTTTGAKTFGPGYLVLSGGNIANDGRGNTGRCTKSSECPNGYICSGCSMGSPNGVCILLAQESNGCVIPAGTNAPEPSPNAGPFTDGPTPASGGSYTNKSPASSGSVGGETPAPASISTGAPAQDNPWPISSSGPGDVPGAAPGIETPGAQPCVPRRCGELLGTCQFPNLPYYASPEIYCDIEYNNGPTDRGYYVVAGGSQANSNFPGDNNGLCNSTANCPGGFMCSSCNGGKNNTGVCILLGTSDNGCDMIRSNTTLSGTITNAPLTNTFKNFETGNLSGWKVQGTANIVTNASGLKPLTNTYVAEIPSGCGNAPNIISTSGELSVNTGYIAVTYYFICNDRAPFDDFSDILLYDSSNLILGDVRVDCSDVGYQNNVKKWTTVAFPVNSATNFTMTVKASSVNFGDCQVNSVLYIDGITYVNKGQDLSGLAASPM